MFFIKLLNPDAFDLQISSKNVYFMAIYFSTVKGLGMPKNWLHMRTEFEIYRIG